MKIHWLDEAATSRAKNKEVVVAWCGEADYPGTYVRRNKPGLVTCPTCKRLMKRVGIEEVSESE